MIAGVCMAKDEADVIEATVGRMVEQVDRVYVADNGSTDGTLEILRGLDVELSEDSNPAFYQSVKTSALAEMARQDGADIVIPFDADEVWSARGYPTLADALGSVPDDVRVVEADLYDYVATGVDANGGDPVRSMEWRRPDPAPLPKVAVRALEGMVIHQGNHGVSYSDQDVPLRLGGLLVVRHYPYRSHEQMVRKARNGAAAYAATHLDESVGAHWRSYGLLSDEQIGDVFRKWYFRSSPQIAIEIDGEVQPALVRDPCQ